MPEFQLYPAPRDIYVKGLHFIYISRQQARVDRQYYGLSGSSVRRSDLSIGKKGPITESSAIERSQGDELISNFMVCVKIRDLDTP
jgi:hypothetical protein